MATTQADPAVIQRVVEPGSTETRHFVLRNPPNDKITATNVGDRTRIRLREMMATVKREIVGEEVFCEELPPNKRPAGCQPGQVVRVPEVAFNVVGQMDGEGSMPVESAASVEGRIEFVASAASLPGVTESILRLRGENWDGLDVPIKMITGAVTVDFGPDGVVAYRGQMVQVPIKVSLPLGHPPATLQLRGFDEAPNWAIDADVDIAGGETVETTLTLTASTTAPLGEASHTLTVSGWDDGNGSKALPVNITTMPAPAVISYRISRFDPAGVLRVEEGQASTTTQQPEQVGTLNRVGESYSYEYSVVDETGTLRLRIGEVKVTGKARVQVATVKLAGSVDGKRLSAKGYAEVVTARIDGSVSAAVLDQSGDASGYAEGPRAQISGEAGLDGAGIEIGASAGEMGGRVDISILGRSYGAGGEIGLKAELGLHWGPTSTIKLPLITISGPNPMAGVASFATGAVRDLVRDPLRTAEQAITDIVGVGEDAVEAIGQVVEAVGSFVDTVGDLFAVDEPNIVITDVQQGPRPRNLSPGAVILD